MGWIESLQRDFVQNFIEKGRYMGLLKGLGVTIEVSMLSAIIGVVLGVIVALAVMSTSNVLKKIGNAYIDIIRGTPSVIQLMIVYYVVLTSPIFPKVVVASIAFGLNSGAYVAEIFRAGIQSIEVGQTEAGRSLGLSKWQTLRFIVIPQALVNIFPALGNEFIVLIKETAVVGYISLTDLTFAGDMIRGATYSAFMPLVGVAVIYFLLIKIVTKLLRIIENRLRKFAK